MFQNHILQLLALTAMEAPTAFSATAVRDEKVKVLQALQPLNGEQALINTFRGQYTAGEIKGQPAVGYKQEANIPLDSITETFLAARLEVASWRWPGVPFFIRSGNRMPKRVTEIAIQFKQVPLPMFDWQNTAGESPNSLVLNIQPEEGITLSISAKKPGPINQIQPVDLEFSYAESFGANPPEAYERLLLDSLNGDATLFTRSDEVETAWKFTSDIIEAWEQEKIKKLPEYHSGSWGPEGLNEFIAETGHHWRKI